MFLLFDIKELWNHEVGFIFPFYRELLVQKIYNCDYFCSDCSFIAYDKGKMVGFIISKIYDNNPIMSKYIDKGWISLIYISTEYRRKGIGSTLLKQAEAIMRGKGVKEIMVGSDYNNFFPGIPNELCECGVKFFEKNGYDLLNTDYDVIKNISNNDCKIINETGYSIRYANTKDREVVLKFFEDNFYGRWYFEALEYFDKFYTPKTYLIIIDNKKVIGFVRVNRYNDKYISYNVNWNKSFAKLAGIGPLGIDKKYRGKGLARASIQTAINDLVKEKVSDIIIDWTSLVSFYKKFGFDVWKSYTHANKVLK